jgi:hypothetical protein
MCIYNKNSDQPISENSSSTYFSYDFNNDILLESALQFGMYKYSMLLLISSHMLFLI